MENNEDRVSQHRCMGSLTIFEFPHGSLRDIGFINLNLVGTNVAL